MPWIPRTVSSIEELDPAKTYRVRIYEKTFPLSWFQNDLYQAWYIDIPGFDGIELRTFWGCPVEERVEPEPPEIHTQHVGVSWGDLGPSYALIQLPLELRGQRIWWAVITPGFRPQMVKEEE
jgi:hypothetical protein